MTSYGAWFRHVHPDYGKKRGPGRPRDPEVAARLLEEERHRAERKIAKQKRTAEIVRLRIEERLTLEEIGERFDLTRERIRQILYAEGIDDRVPTRVGREQRERQQALTDEQLMVELRDSVDV